MSYSKEPAFPVNELDQVTGTICVQHFGMNLRDYFAAKAMQAMIAKGMSEGHKCGPGGVPIIAKYAYEYADEMLRQRAAMAAPTPTPTPAPEAKP